MRNQLLTARTSAAALEPGKEHFQGVALTLSSMLVIYHVLNQNTSKNRVERAASPLGWSNSIVWWRLPACPQAHLQASVCALNVLEQVKASAAGVGSCAATHHTGSQSTLNSTQTRVEFSAQVRQQDAARLSLQAFDWPNFGLTLSSFIRPTRPAKANSRL